MVEHRGTIVRRGHEVGNRFRVDAVAGQGASGTVYRALDQRTGDTVALKLVQIDRDEQEQRFVREVAAISEIEHPGVVRYVDHGVGASDERTRYLAMEWLDGRDLRASLTARRFDADVSGTLAETSAGPELSLSARGPMSVADVLALGRALASALAKVHAAGVVHRDIKPSNIFLIDGDVRRPKLVDFGVARVARGPLDVALTKTGAFVGTPLYMSPEQARTETTITAATDVWSLGAVLYECLAGAPPFSGQHFSAVLARILLDDPPSLAANGDIPLAFERAVRTMLRKEVQARPADGRAALALLDEVGEVPEAPLLVSRDAEAHPRATQVFTADERRINCVLFARLRHASRLDVTRIEGPAAELFGESTEATGDDRVGAPPPVLDEFERVRRHGRLELLADGTLMLVPHASNPKDQAIEAARAAMALCASDPDVAAFIAMGRSASSTRADLGALLDHAVGTLARARPGQLLLDEAVSRLVDGRFELAREAGAFGLRRELDAEERRLLLGRPTKVVGRRRELGLLDATWEEVVEDASARAVLMIAPAGAGKSRLRWEFERRVERRDVEHVLVLGQGDSLSAGAAFGLVAPAVRRWFGIDQGEAAASRRDKVRAGCRALLGDDEQARRAALFLGELVDAQFDASLDPALAAARKDPMLRGQSMGDAFVRWLSALTRRSPVLVVLEDLHWGDRPSIQFLDQALRDLEDAPLMIAATARPEVRDAFPRLWRGRPLQVLDLEPLSRRACGQLVEQVLGDEIPAPMREDIVARCEGNALYLEELIRAAAQGDAEGTPETVLGMVEARLDALGPGPKHVLKVASVFGEVFWAHGVADLLRGAAEPGSVDVWLEALAEDEVVRRQPESQLSGQVEYRFHHALVRDAAYGTMTDDDRASAHLGVARWLVDAGASEALMLAGHFDRGGASDEAASWYERAARQALEGGDLEGARARTERALELARDDERRGRLRALASIAAYWQSDYEAARTSGDAALDALEVGTQDWYVAAGSTLVSSARLADADHVKRLFRAITTSAPADDAHSERLIAMCRGAFQLVFAGRFDEADPVLARIAEELDGEDDIDALTRAQAHHVQGVRAAHVGDVARFLHHLERAVAAFDAAGDRRNVALERTTVAWCHAELGDLKRAETLCRASLAHCEEIRATQAVTYAKVNLGYILSLRGPATGDEARRVLLDAIAACGAVGNRRLEGWARAHLSGVEHRAGAHALELEHASTAVELLGTTPGLRAWALACRARARQALGRCREALVDADAAMAVVDQLGGILQGESLPPLVRAQALVTLRDPAAEDAVRDAHARLAARAERLGDPRWKASFLTLPDNATTMRLEA